MKIQVADFVAPKRQFAAEIGLEWMPGVVVYEDIQCVLIVSIEPNVLQRCRRYDVDGDRSSGKIRPTTIPLHPRSP